MCTEVSIEAYIKNKASGAMAADMLFVPIDSLAVRQPFLGYWETLASFHAQRMIALLVKYHADPNTSQNDAAKVLYVNKVRSAGLLVITLSQLAHRSSRSSSSFLRTITKSLALTSNRSLSSGALRLAM